MSSSVNFSDSEELVVDVALVLRSDFVISFAFPEDVLRGGSAALALWVVAHASCGKFGGMESARRPYTSSDGGLLSPFLLRREFVRLPQFVSIITVFAGQFGVALQVSHSGLHVDERSDLVHVFPVVLFARRCAVDQLGDHIVATSFSNARFKMRLVIGSEVDLGTQGSK